MHCDRRRQMRIHDRRPHEPKEQSRRRHAFKQKPPVTHAVNYYLTYPRFQTGRDRAGARSLSVSAYLQLMLDESADQPKRSAAARIDDRYRFAYRWNAGQIQELKPADWRRNGGQQVDRCCHH